MHIRIVSVSESITSWMKQGYETYQKRLPSYINVELIHVKPEKRNKNGSADVVRSREAERLLKAVSKGDWVIALDEHGKQWSSKVLATELEQWMQNGKNISLLIGGADGLDQQCIDRADVVWSLSQLTFPHGFIPLLLAEQIYRACTLIQGHPYHRGDARKS